MFRLPRLAIGSVRPGVDPQPMCLALMSLVAGQGQRVQHFLSTACFPRLDGATPATGVNSRHLDSWLMTPDLAREVFAHGASGADLAVVEGAYATAHASDGRGGTLDDLCAALDLPRVAVVDVSRMSGCCLPQRPADADGMLLDNVRDAHHFAELQTTLESLWRIPVLGAIEELPQVREELARVPRGAAPETELCRALAANLARYVRHDRLIELAARRPFPGVRPCAFLASPPSEGIRVAVAFDEAFRCYFPDTLDLLELHGATIVDFSPLRDEALPTDVDLVYLGCGHPERHAAALAQNHCMLLALREHLCSGRRLYAEGGGLAYLCEHLDAPDGERFAMVGALPAVARPNQQPAPPMPVELTLARRSWLARPGTSLRGYLNSNWTIEPTGRITSLVRETARQHDLVGRFLAIGSRLHLNAVSQPEVLRGFVRPTCEAAAVT